MAEEIFNIKQEIKEEGGEEAMDWTPEPGEIQEIAPGIVVKEEPGKPSFRMGEMPIVEIDLTVLPDEEHDMFQRDLVLAVSII